MKNLNPSKAGKASAAKLTPEERIERAANAAKARYGQTDVHTDETDLSTDLSTDVHTD